MKTVFSNRQTAHVWAQQNQPTGRNASGSISFDGPTLYSYRTPIAYIPDGAQYGLVALLTSETYSTTTSTKHMPAARSAVSGHRTWRVPRLAVDKASLRTNVDYLKRGYLEEIAQMMRCPAESHRLQNRTGNELAWPTYAHMILNQMADNIADFRKLFDVPGPVLSWKESADQIIARRDRILSDPKRVAKMAKDAEFRAEGERLAEAARVVRAQFEFAQNEQNRQEWLAGMEYSGTLSDERGGAMLRLSAGGYEIETSWGASVPRIDAVRVLKLYRSIWWPGQPAWYPPADFAAPLTMGSFKLNCIHCDGSIKVGCHTIYPDQIDRLQAILRSKGHI